MNKQEYDQIADQLLPKPKVFKNSFIAFICGGIIGVIGQVILELAQYYFSFGIKEATPVMVIVMIFAASLLTALGIYDRIARIAGAGTFVPITGFANSMTSCAMEGRSEGLVTGIGVSIFKLGGSVITFGIVASFVLGGIRYVFEYFW